MNIGDRVRLLHGNEEGRIVAFKEKNIVEIEIDDGFIIPALKNEIVFISEQEGDYFGTKPSPSYSEPRSQPKDQKNEMVGLFLGFVPVNEQDLSVYLINTTEQKIVYSIAEYYETNSKGIDAGTINPGNSNFVTYFKLENFEKWPVISVQLIQFNQRINTHRPPIEKLLKFKASSFFKSKTMLPLMEKEGYLVNLPLATKEIKAEEIQNELIEHQSSAAANDLFKKDLKTGGRSEIDLHVEVLFNDPSELNQEVILNQQLEAFEKALNDAMVTGKDQLKIIHGVGNGILRHEIHKRLSQLKKIKYFEDSDKSKFGYGATLVHLL